ncbi:unnamed protein product [Moneuplotes crassus]|uniref:Uncharacterized protein n=1 Tax=Euplotes crassus TaxID=5936 RepID=A0AAD2D2U6_EUPCR|nr:unnamed protein product [Moneuplotes crassus]
MGGNSSQEAVQSSEDLKIIEHFETYYNKATTEEQKNEILKLLYDSFTHPKYFKENMDLFLNKISDEKHRKIKYKNFAFLMELFLNGNETTDNTVLALDVCKELTYHPLTWQELSKSKFKFATIENSKEIIHDAILEVFYVKKMCEYIDIVEKKFLRAKRKRNEEEADNPENERAKKLFYTISQNIKLSLSFKDIYNNRSSQKGKLKYLCDNMDNFLKFKSKVKNTSITFENADDLQLLTVKRYFSSGLLIMLIRVIMNHNFSLNSLQNKKISQEIKTQGFEVLEECIDVLLRLCKMKSDFVNKKIYLHLNFVQILLYILDWNEDSIVGIRVKILKCLKSLTNNRAVFKDAELLPMALKVLLKATNTDNKELVALSLECVINIIILEKSPPEEVSGVKSSSDNGGAYEEPMSGSQGAKYQNLNSRVRYKQSAITQFEKCINNFKLSEKEKEDLYINKATISEDTKLKEQIIFNCRVGLFLMCKEAHSLKEIFKMKGIKNDMDHKVRFSKILLNYSLEAPNSGLGSSFRVFVEPFFYLLNVVIHKENRLYFHHKPAYYRDILKSKVHQKENYHETKVDEKNKKEDENNFDDEFFEDTNQNSHQEDIKEACNQLLEERRSKYISRRPNNSSEEEKSIKEEYDPKRDEEMEKERSFFLENKENFNEIESNILTSLSRISLQRESHPIILQKIEDNTSDKRESRYYIERLIYFIQLSVDQLKEIKYCKGKKLT